MGKGKKTISDIKITSQLSYTSVLSFEMHGKEGQHGYAKVLVEVSDNTEEARVSSLKGSEMEIRIKDGTLLMKGICHTAGMSNRSGYKTVDLEIVTMSQKADEKKDDLVFQDPGKTLSDMAKKVLEPYGIQLKCEEDVPISQVVYRQKETAWQFIKRISGQYQKSVYADFRSKQIMIGSTGNESHAQDILQEAEGEGKNIQELRLAQSNSRTMTGAYAYEEKTYRTNTLDALVGDTCGSDIIIGATIAAEGGSLVNHITLKKKKDAKPSQARQTGKNLFSSVVSGTVTAVDGNQIQVKFAANGGLSGGSTWVPYESAISNSFYCMPDVGDEVFLYYENNGKIVCLGSKRSGGGHPDYDKPEEKSLTSDDKMIKFTKTGVVLTATRELYDAGSEQGITIRMDDSEGIVIESGQNVLISAEENLLLKAGKKTAKENSESLKAGKEKFAQREQAGAQEYAEDSGMSPEEQLGKSILAGLGSFGSDVAESFVEGAKSMVFYDIWGGKGNSEEEPQEEEVFETGVLSLYGMEGLVLSVGESTINLGEEINFSSPHFRWLGYEQGEHAKEELPLKDWWETALDGLQLVLDIAGFIPGVGDVLDIVNAGISLARGDYFGAACSLVSAIPGVGSFIGGAAKGVKAVGKAAKALSKMKKVLKYAEYFYSVVEFAAQIYRSKDDIAKMAQLLMSGEFDITNREHVDLLISMGNLGVATAGMAKKTKDTFKKDKGDGPSKKTDNEDPDSKNKKTTQGNDKPQDKQTCKYDPINVVTGSQTLIYTDIEIEDILKSVYFRRTYESIYKNEKGMFGSRWMSMVETNITEKDGKTIVQLPDMSLVEYKKTESGFENVRKGDGAYRLYETEEGYMLRSISEKDTYHYLKNGQLSYIEDLNRNRTQMTYVGTRLTRITYASGQYLEFFYEEDHVTVIRDILGRETKYAYEGDFLTEVTMADGGQIRYTYTPEGYLRTVTDQNGKTYVTNYYDRRGRVVRQEMSSGEEYVMFYDDVAKENTFVTTSNGNKIIYAYGREKLPTRITYADGSYEENVYDEKHNIISYRDRNGGITEKKYDDRSRLVFEKKPGGLETHYTYNELDLVTEIRDNAGWEETRSYDKVGNLLERNCRIDEIRKQKTTYTYDRHGRMLSKTDALGNETSYSYETGFYFVSEMEAPEGIHVSYTYDKAGRNMSVSHAYGTRHYGYNHLNMITMEENEEGAQVKTSYDHLGNVVKVTYPGAAEGESIITRYEYDDLDNMVRTIHPDGRIMAYDKDVEGNILKEIHPNSYDSESGDGEGIRHEYDRDGNRIRSIYPDGGVEQFFYDPSGNLIRHIFPQENATKKEAARGYTYAYDADDRLVRVTNPEGTVEKVYEYDLAGNVISEMDAQGYALAERGIEGAATLYSYNVMGWMTEKREPLMEEDGVINYRLTMYTYDANGNCIEEKRYRDYQDRQSARGIVHTIRFAYDKAGRLVQVSDCTGAVMEYAYDKQNRRVMEKHKLSDDVYGEKHYYYSPAGYLTKIMERVDEEGTGGSKYGRTIYEYDANGNLTRMETPLGHEIRRTYNANHEVISETHRQADGSIDYTTTFAYDKAGNMVKMEQEDGVFESYTYDLLNRRVKIRHKNGGVSQTDYDLDGRVLREIRPNDYEKGGESADAYQYSYDVLGRETALKGPDGNLIYEKSYNAAGYLTAQRDARGGGIAYVYDLAGRRILAKTEGDSRQCYAYDAQGRVIKSTDGNGNETRYETDHWGRITRILTADGAQESYAYDHAGNMVEATDAAGHTVKYRYNAMSLMSERTDAAGESEKFIYDAQGNLSEHQDRNGTRTLYRYNMYGALTLRENRESGLQEVYGYGKDGRLSYAIGGGMRYDYTYHADGSVKEKKASGRILLSYEYDRNGNRIAQTDLTGKRSEYVYNSLDLLTEVRDNGKTLARYDYETDGMIRSLTVGEDIITSYAYDADKNITAQKTVMGSDVIVDNRYGYDGNGNRMFRHTMSGHTTYRYDERNRLVEAEYPKYRESLRYDMAGNRIERQTETVKELYTYDSCNRLTERRKAENGKEDLRETYAYDRQGNLLECTKEREGAKPETSRFTYDAFGRQSSARMYDGRVQVNRYDAEGLRHEMEENGQLVTFLYSGREVVAEESETTGMLRYIRGYELISSDSESARTYYHYVGDEDGSITHVVGNAEDESGAQAGRYRIFNHYEYDAFGAYQIREESVHNRFGYNGEQYDPVTGQYYLRARYYNPVIGRFTQEDTYYGDGLNLYAYCHNNPVKYSDPSGHDALCDKGAKTLEEKKKNGGLTADEQKLLDDYYRRKAEESGRSSSKGRSGKQKRLREIANDDKVSSALRGEIKRDINEIKRGKRKNIRVPSGYQMAHRRGYEARKGFGYEFSDLNTIENHKRQHKIDGYGRRKK